MSRGWLKALLALYPRAWRRQHEDEMTQLLADLEADQTGSRVRHLVDLLLNAAPVQIAYHPAATSFLVLCASGALAVTAASTQMAARSRQAAITFSRSDQALIVREPHATYSSKGYTIRFGTTGTPVVTVKAISQTGARSTLTCRSGKCRSR
jgi:hypothetical protein